MVDTDNLPQIPSPEQMYASMRTTQQLEEARHAQNLELELIKAKTEATRLAQATLIENRRNLPYSERGVTAEEITAYADTLLDYIKQK